MPSPFPGMDPFLEHPAYFPDLHTRFITRLSEELMEKLPEPYFAVLNQRLWVEASDRLIEPDVDVVYPTQESTFAEPQGEASALATLAGTQPIVITIPHDERRETFIEVLRHTKRGIRVVTTIELLSLSNKTGEEHGRALYLQKQTEVLGGKISLVEIDLLRGGLHTTAVPKKKLLNKSGPFDYHVCVAPAREWQNRYVYTSRMQNALPRIPIPLRAADEPIAVDLQAVFNRCYDAGPYRRQVVYELDQIIPPLSPEQASWAARVLAKN